MLLKLINPVRPLPTTVVPSNPLGNSVLSTKPLQAVLSVPNLSSACSGCLLTPREIAIKTGRTRSLSPCVACNVLNYCSDVSEFILLSSHLLTARSAEF